MKTFLRLLCIFMCAASLTGCSHLPGPQDSTAGTPATAASDPVLQGVWISYYELQFAGKTYAEFCAEIDQAFTTVAKNGFNAVFCHVRPNADAYYPSAVFPWSDALTGTPGADPGYDPLAYMVTAAHDRGLQFHAWINPYRISAKSTQISTLAPQHIARRWLEDDDPQNDHYIAFATGGMYFNPAVPAVQKLIIDGVQEILQNYAVDGIQFDDYFYPTTDLEFDKQAYTAYATATAMPLALEDWRRTHINALISAVYRTVREFAGVKFGISPSAHISADGSDKNYTQSYADVALWINSTAYVDYIAPQLYFGYEYPQVEFTFADLLQKWMALPRSQSVALYIGLAGYKIGNENQIGAQEWLQSTDILARQAQDAYNAGAHGVLLYSYSTLASQDPLCLQQARALRQVLLKNKDG